LLKNELIINPLQLCVVKGNVVFTCLHFPPSSHIKTSARHCPKPKQHQNEIKGFITTPIGKFSLFLQGVMPLSCPLFFISQLTTVMVIHH